MYLRKELLMKKNKFFLFVYIVHIKENMNNVPNVTWAWVIFLSSVDN